MRKTMSLLAAATLAAGVFAAPAYTGPVKAQEVRARAGVGHFLEKVKAGKEVTVAYLGGSITAMNGWRNLTTDWLRATYPQAKFKEIHAAIGGTGSNLGVFRVAHDALRHNPDLLFVEFATNDGGAQPQAIWRSMEGIVRQTWKKDPSTDIVFTYTITHAMKQDYLAGNCNRAASAMEQLADHYGIPSICFGPRVIDAVKAGTLVMKGSEPHEGKTLFAQDGVHPGLPGHKFYLASIVNGFTQMKDMPPADQKGYSVLRCGGRMSEITSTASELPARESGEPFGTRIEARSRQLLSEPWRETAPLSCERAAELILHAKDPAWLSRGRAGADDASWPEVKRGSWVEKWVRYRLTDKKSGKQNPDEFDEPLQETPSVADWDSVDSMDEDLIWMDDQAFDEEEW